MNDETDIIEFDFPDYEEPYPPFPDVKTAPVDMDEAYLRNAELAKRLSSDIAEPTEKAKPVPRKKKAAKPRGRKIIIAAAAYAAAFIGILAAVFFTNVQKPEDIGSGMNLTIRTDYEECAEFEQRLENIISFTDSGGRRQYEVTIGFTMKNLADDPVIFFPKLLDVYLDNDSFSSPVATEGTRDFDGGVFAVINYQKDFAVTYRLDEDEIPRIKYFGYGLPYRYKIDADSKVKEEIEAFLSDEAQEGIS